MKPPRISTLGQKILDALRAHPEGLTIRQLREATGSTDEQEHFNRRLRDLRKHYALPLLRDGTRQFYRLGALKSAPAPDSGAISEKIRSHVLHLAHGRCQQCGKTIADDGIKLQIDHRIPQAWGGATELDNLWALCEACNRGKRDFFASLNSDDMKEIVQHPTVHGRIAHLLKRHLGEPVASDLIEFVANATEQQEDWQKRLRDLRYPGIDLDITVSKKTINGRVKSFYTLNNWIELPANHQQIIRTHDNKNKKK